MDMKKYILILLVFISAVLINAEAAKSEFNNEKFYSDSICIVDFQGKPSRTKQGLYIDCETEFTAIEFDWAKRPKNYECIGQAIVYAVQTGKIPVCVLLARTEKEYHFGLNQTEYFKKAGVILRVIRINKL